jgi:TP901 family phage tail tape measure protein
MSNPIGFDKLFDAGSFDAGTKKIAEYIERITDEITKAEIAADDLTKVMGKQLKAEIAQLSSASKMLSKDMQVMAQKMNDFKTTTSNTKKVLSDYERENEKLRKELERLKNAQTGVSKETAKAGVSFKTTAQSMLGLAGGAAMVYSGIRILKEQLIVAGKAVMEFDQAMKEVEAISRASSAQIEALRDNANKLGASTEKTAIQVAGLQKELAKLGFSTSEIIAASKAIVDLSTATGEDLAGSAQVVASTLRAFGLEATETVRVVDTMAGSFVRSGLDLEKFRESMKLVAPIARATGVDIETTTGALSKLADAGLSGSLAGTALRNLLSEMADPTSKLSEFLGYTVKSSEDLTRAFSDLSARGVDLAQAVQMVDVRARPAFFILLNQIQAVKGLAKEYKSLTGEGERLATMMRDTLANDVEIASSAFDALRRNLLEGSTGEIRGAVQALTTLVEATRLMSEGYMFGESAIGGFITELKELGGILNPINNYLNLMKSIGIDLVSMWESFEVETAKARDAFQEDEWIKKSKGDLEAIKKAGEEVKFSPLISEYNKLSQVVNKTSTESERLKEIERKLLFQYGETAIAIDKTTGKYFLNISAIERTIERNSAEAITIQNTNKERLKEIDNKIQLHRETYRSLNLQGKWTEALELELGKAYEINRLLIEKKTLLDTLGGSLSTIANTSKNGWSVYVEGAESAISYAEFLAKKEENLKTAAEERLKLFNLIAARSKARIDEEIRQASYMEGEEAFIKKISETQKKADDKYLEGLFEKEIGEFELTKAKAKATKERIALEMRQGEETKKIVEGIQKTKEEARKAEIEKEKEKVDKILEINQMMGQGLSRITTFFFDNRQAQREIELEAIANWQDEQTRLAGDNEDAKLRIELQAERRRSEIKRKQAQDNKRETLYQLALDTAASVVKSILMNGGIPLGLPFGAIAAALGAAQMALVASRPIPQFAKGTDDSPEGFAEVGERGRELIRDGKTGKWAITPNSSTVTYLTKHSQVITNAETERILAQDHNSKADNYLSNTIKQLKPQQIDYSKIGQEVGKHISKIPVNVTNFDQDGVTKFVMGRSSKITRLNKRY